MIKQEFRFTKLVFTDMAIVDCTLNLDEGKRSLTVEDLEKMNITWNNFSESEILEVVDEDAWLVTNVTSGSQVMLLEDLGGNEDDAGLFRREASATSVAPSKRNGDIAHWMLKTCTVVHEWYILEVHEL
ncbi:hypothetical protein ACJX0J_032456 [Zea mays]